MSDLVLSSDTPNAGRVKWNNNDAEHDQAIADQNAALAAHKTSSDHDVRYYTETEIDAQQAAQDAALNTHKTSGDHDGRYYTRSEIDTQQAAQDAALNTHKTSGDHDGRYYTETEINSLLAQRRVRLVLDGIIKATKSSFTVEGISGYEFVLPRAGCITAVGVKDLNGGTVEYKTQTYRASGTTAQGRYSAGSRIGFFRSTSLGSNYPTINGVAVNAAGLDSISIISEAGDYAVTLVCEEDTGDSIGGID